MSNLEDIGLAAVDQFINTWNSRDPEQWASSLNYPHVRPSPMGPIQAAPSAEAYAAGVNYERVISSGWDHSEWDYKHVIHVSPDKIHVAGQWTRVNAEGETILTIPVTYIVTCVDDHWGIQARFGCDYAGDDDTSGFELRAFRHLDTFIHNWNQGNHEACAEMLNYPHYRVGIGALETINEASEMPPPAGKISLNQSLALQTGKRGINIAADVTFSTDDGSSPYQLVMQMTDRDDHLGIQAWSILNPDIEEE